MLVDRKQKSNSGGALIQVLIGVALLGALTLVTMQNMQLSQDLASRGHFKTNADVLQDMVYMNLANTTLCKIALSAPVKSLQFGGGGPWNRLTIADASDADGQAINALDVGLLNSVGASQLLMDPSANGGTPITIESLGLRLTNFKIKCKKAGCACEDLEPPAGCDDWDTGTVAVDRVIAADILYGLNPVGSSLQFGNSNLRKVEVFLHTRDAGANFNVEECEAKESDSRICAKLGGIYMGFKDCRMPYNPFNCPYPLIAVPDNDPTNVADDGDNVPDCVAAASAKCPFGEYVKSMDNNVLNCAAIGYTWLVPPVWSACGAAGTPVAGQNRKFRDVQCINVASSTLVVPDARCAGKPMPVETAPCCQAEVFNWLGGPPYPATCTDTAPLTNDIALPPIPLSTPPFPEGSATVVCDDTNGDGFGEFTLNPIMCHDDMCDEVTLEQNCDLSGLGAFALSTSTTLVMNGGPFPAFPPECANPILCAGCNWISRTDILSDDPASIACPGAPPPPNTCPANVVNWSVVPSNCTANTPAMAAGMNTNVQDLAGPDTGSTTINCPAGGGVPNVVGPSTCSTMQCTAVAGAVTWTDPVTSRTCTNTNALTIAEGASDTFIDGDAADLQTGSAVFQCTGGSLIGPIVATCTAPPCTAAPGSLSWTDPITSYTCTNTNLETILDNTVRTIADTDPSENLTGAADFRCDLNVIQPPTNAVCNPVAAPDCVAAAGTLTWMNGTLLCRNTLPVTVPAGTTQTVSDTDNSDFKMGSADYTCDPTAGVFLSPPTAIDCHSTSVDCNCDAEGCSWTDITGTKTCTNTAATGVILDGNTAAVTDTTPTSLGNATLLCTAGVITAQPGAICTTTLASVWVNSKNSCPVGYIKIGLQDDGLGCGGPKHELEEDSRCGPATSDLCVSGITDAVWVQEPNPCPAGYIYAQLRDEWNAASTWHNVNEDKWNGGGFQRMCIKGVSAISWAGACLAPSHWAGGVTDDDDGDFRLDQAYPLEGPIRQWCWTP